MCNVYVYFCSENATIFHYCITKKNISKRLFLIHWCISYVSQYVSYEVIYFNKMIVTI